MKFYKHLYCGESVIADKKKICRKLKSNAGQLQIYVITLATDQNQLEIYHCAYLQQKYYKNHPPFIVGIAKGYEEAVALVTKITQEVIEKTGNANIKEYILDCS